MKLKPFILAKHPKDLKRVLVADLELGKIEWRSQVDDSADGPAPTEGDVRAFLWRNRGKSFKDVRVVYISARSDHSIDLNGQLWVNGRYFGTFVEIPSAPKLRTALRYGAVFVTDVPPDSMIYRFEAREFPDSQSTNIKDDSQDRRESGPTELSGMDRHFFDLLTRSNEPLKETLERIDRKLQDISTLRELIQKVDMRVRSLSTGNPAPSRNDEVNVNRQSEADTARNLAKLEAELAVYQHRFESVQVALNDAEHRLATAESRIADEICSVFKEAIAQTRVYATTDFGQTFYGDLRRRAEEQMDGLTLDERAILSTKLEPIFQLVSQRWEHMLYTISLVDKAFLDLGWLPKR